MSYAISNDTSLQNARIVQASILGEDVLVAFSNGTSVVLDAAAIRNLALTAAKKTVTEQDAISSEEDFGAEN